MYSIIFIISFLKMVIFEDKIILVLKKTPESLMNFSVFELNSIYVL